MAESDTPDRRSLAIAMEILCGSGAVQGPRAASPAVRELFSAKSGASGLYYDYGNEFCPLLGALANVQSAWVEADRAGLQSALAQVSDLLKSVKFYFEYAQEKELSGELPAAARRVDRAVAVLRIAGQRAEEKGILSFPKVWISLVTAFTEIYGSAGCQLRLDGWASILTREFGEACTKGFPAPSAAVSTAAGSFPLPTDLSQAVLYSQKS